MSSAYNGFGLLYRHVNTSVDIGLFVKLGYDFFFDAMALQKYTSVSSKLTETQTCMLKSNLK